MTSVLVAKPCCTNEGLCGRMVAVQVADIWHHENAPCAPSTLVGRGREHPGRLSTGGGSGLISKQREINPYCSSEPSKPVLAKPVSLKTPFSLKGIICLLPLMQSG